MNTKKSLGSMIVALILCLGTTNISAQTAAHKLGRGLAAMTCGVMELPGTMISETREKGALGLPVGLALGLGRIVTRELVGVYEFLTAPFPVPTGFAPILKPEYPWDYFR